MFLHTQHTKISHKDRRYRTPYNRGAYSIAETSFLCYYFPLKFRLASYLNKRLCTHIYISGNKHKTLFSNTNKTHNDVKRWHEQDLLIVPYILHHFCCFEAKKKRNNSHDFVNILNKFQSFMTFFLKLWQGL